MEIVGQGVSALVDVDAGGVGGGVDDADFGRGGVADDGLAAGERCEGGCGGGESDEMTCGECG